MSDVFDYNEPYPEGSIPIHIGTGPYEIYITNELNKTGWIKDHEHKFVCDWFIVDKMIYGKKTGQYRRLAGLDRVEEIHTKIHKYYLGLNND